MEDLTHEQHSGQVPVQAQLFPELVLGPQAHVEHRPDGQAVHHDLALLQAIAQGAALAVLGRHKASVHAWVEPGVVAGGQVRDHRREGHGRQLALPAACTPGQDMLWLH